MQDRDDDLPISDDDIVDSHQTVLKYFQSAYSTKHTPYVSLEFTLYIFLLTTYFKGAYDWE